MIIYVDPADELNTIVHRIRLEEDSEIVLVVPPENWALRDRINIKLLAKYAKDSQKNLVIKTGDPLIIKHAEAVELRVIRDESAAAVEDGDEEAVEVRHRNRQSRDRVERLIVLLLIAASVLGLAYYHLPKAVIVVSPKQETFKYTLQVPLDGLDGIELASVQTLLTRRTPATGRKIVGISRAVGAVTLINQSQSEAAVAKGTILETGSGILFRTTKDVVVPAVTTQYFMDIPTGLTAGKAEVEIEAVEAGSQGNVAAGRIVAIRGYDLEVRNSDPTSGGEDVVLEVAVREDIERAQNLVRRDGKQELRDALIVQLGGRLMIDETFKIDIEWTNMSQVDEETSEVFASGICVGKAYLVDLDQLSRATAALLAEAVPDGFVLVPETVSFDSVSINETEAGYQLNLRTQAVIRGVIDEATLAQQLAGREDEEIDTVLIANPGVARIYVESGPQDKLPQLPRWLKIKVEEPVY